MKEMAPKTMGKIAQRGRGRPRDARARRRILKAAFDLMEETTFAHVTTEAIAARAGVSKATVYRWWTNKAAVVIEAFREAFEPQLPLRHSGSLREDLTFQMRNFARVLSGSGGRMLRSFIVAARSDPEVAAAFRSIWSDRAARGRAAHAPGKASERTIAERRRRGSGARLALRPALLPLLVKNSPPSQKYAAAVTDLVIQGLE